MTEVEAYHYTRKFISEHREFIPILQDGFYFLLTSDYVYLRNKHDNLSYSYKIYSKKNFQEKFKNFNLTKINIDELATKLNFDLNTLSNFDNMCFIIEEPMIFTSKGLIDIETFELAQDIMETISYIKKGNILLDGIYLGINGYKYLYIGDTERYKDQFYSFKQDFVVNRTSIKVFKYLGQQEEKIYSYYYPGKNNSKFLKEKK